MVVRTVALSALLMFFWVLAGPAKADDCGPLKLLNSIDMQSGPAGLRMFVPVTINNVPELLLLDTGGEITQLSTATVENLKLFKRESPVKLLDLRGNASREMAHVDTFNLGQMQGKDMEFIISPDKNMGQGRPPFGGILAGDLMSHYDVDLDFAARKLNYFSPDHCDGHVVYWTAPVVAVVPMTLKSTHIKVQVMVDGHALSADLDTGSTRTTMSADVARTVFGVTVESPGSVPLGIANSDPNLRVFGYVFGNLSFEGVAVNSPHIVVLPDMVGSKDPENNFKTGSHVEHVDDDIGSQLLIGMDVLTKLHLYIAFRERNLYITAASKAGDASALAPTTTSTSPPSTTQ